MSSVVLKYHLSFLNERINVMPLRKWAVRAACMIKHSWLNFTSLVLCSVVIFISMCDREQDMPT